MKTDYNPFYDGNEHVGFYSNGLDTSNVIVYDAYAIIESQWVDENCISHEYDGRKGYIVLNEGVTEIGEGAFAENFGLNEVNMPSTIKKIGEGAFYASVLRSVNIPDSVTEICDGAFCNCMYLQSVSIPASVTKIGKDAFAGCGEIVSIVVDKSNPIYDSRDNCNAIIETATNTLLFGCNNTVVPNTISEIGENAFYDCSGLKSVDLPDTLRRIGDSAFNGCSSLAKLMILSSVTRIGEGAFYACGGLMSIVVDTNNVVYDSRNNCNAIIETRTGRLVAGCANTVIPDSVTCIGEGAFADCYGLTSMLIPDTIESIGAYAFKACSGMTSVNIPPTLTLLYPHQLHSELVRYWELVFSVYSKHGGRN